MLPQSAGLGGWRALDFSTNRFGEVELWQKVRWHNSYIRKDPI